MPRYAKKALPDGWAVIETSDGKWQAFEEKRPERRSSKMSRRVQVVTWAWEQVGQDAQRAARQ